MPEAMQAQLLELEAQFKEPVNQVTLSHAHLNKWSKLQSQIQGQLRKIKDLDTAWEVFLKSATDRVLEHAQMYQQCRANMAETLQAKREELAKIKETISTASQNLLDKGTEDSAVPEMPSVAEALAQFQVATQQASEVVLLEEMETDMDGQIEESEGKDKPEASKARVARPFSHHAPQSPHKVAPTIAKTKETKS
eukprot:Skav213598  [mRNA]  locus=scaffold1971:2659:3243:- [translate_table: standard]